MDAKLKRREEDFKKIKKLSDDYSGIISILNVDRSLSQFKLQFQIPTAYNSNFPDDVQSKTDICIDLPLFYPLKEPKVTILTPIWNPNVYHNKIVCLGTKWIPTQGLDLLVIRLMRLIALDPTIINTKSPANATASEWYARKLHTMPNLFPTVDIDKIRKGEKKQGIGWRNIETPTDDKIIIVCKNCGTKLRVTKGKKLRGNCPNCSHLIEVFT
jgi:ubiquitin-protein ligase